MAGDSLLTRGNNLSDSTYQSRLRSSVMGNIAVMLSEQTDIYLMISALSVDLSVKVTVTDRAAFGSESIPLSAAYR